MSGSTECMTDTSGGRRDPPWRMGLVISGLIDAINPRQPGWTLPLLQIPHCNYTSMRQAESHPHVYLINNWHGLQFLLIWHLTYRQILVHIYPKHRFICSSFPAPSHRNTNYWGKHGKKKKSININLSITLQPILFYHGPPKNTDVITPDCLFPLDMNHTPTTTLLLSLFRTNYF